MPARAMSGAAQPAMLRPANRKVPRLGFHNPMMVRKVVVLPAPLRPSSTVMAPSGTAKSTPCRMWYCPIWVCTPCSSNSGSAMARAPGRYTQIGLLYDRRGNHLGRSTIGHQASVVQDDDAVGEASHHVHFVLDQQNRFVALGFQRLDQVEHDRHVVDRHTSRRLVEHEYVRFERHHDRHLELALVAVRQGHG